MKTFLKTLGNDARVHIASVSNCIISAQTFECTFLTYIIIFCFTDIRTVQERSGIRRLEGADLKISNPPVCNSVLITCLNKNTTKQTIEMYFENEKNGGGKIYGDIIYQKDQGKAVVSFCDPSGKVYYYIVCFISAGAVINK